MPKIIWKLRGSLLNTLKSSWGRFFLWSFGRVGKAMGLKRKNTDKTDKEDKYNTKWQKAGWITGFWAEFVFGGWRRRHFLLPRNLFCEIYPIWYLQSKSRHRWDNRTQQYTEGNLPVINSSLWTEKHHMLNDVVMH